MQRQDLSIIRQYPAQLRASNAVQHSYIIGTRGTIDVSHTVPFGIVDVLGAFDLRDQTSLWALLGATVLANSFAPMCFCCLVSHIRREPEVGARRLVEKGDRSGGVTWGNHAWASGRGAAPGVASAIVCVTKPTWNMKQRLVRQQECEGRQVAPAGLL